MPGLSKDPYPLQPACGQHLLLFLFLMVATLSEVRWDLGVFWLVVSWSLRIFFLFYWPFLLLLLRTFCSVHLPLYLSDHLVFFMFIFVIYNLDINSLCDYSDKDFLPCCRLSCHSVNCCFHYIEDFCFISWISIRVSLLLESFSECLCLCLYC